MSNAWTTEEKDLGYASIKQLSILWRYPCYDRQASRMIWITVEIPLPLNGFVQYCFHGGVHARRCNEVSKNNEPELTGEMVWVCVVTKTDQDTAESEKEP